MLPSGPLSRPNPIVAPLLLLVLAAVFPYGAAARSDYTITEITSRSRNEPISPTGLNNNGDVAGIYTSQTSGKRRAFVWNLALGFRDIGALQEGSLAATSINDQGVVAGFGYTQNGNHAFTWTAESGIADLGIPAGSVDSQATKISNSGFVMGRSQRLPSQNGQIFSTFLYKPSQGFQYLPIAMGERGSDVFALDMNVLDEVVGYGAAPAGTRGFFYAPGKAFQLLSPSAGDNRSEAQAINDFEQIVGCTRNPANVTACLWEDPLSPMRLGCLPGDNGSNAFDINNFGQVVGVSAVNILNPIRQRAFVWTAERGMRDLNDMIPQSPGLALEGAFAINDRGQILVRFTSNHYAILTPTRKIGTIPPESIRMTTRDPDGKGNYGSERDVVGIICDNSLGTYPSDRDCLVLSLPSSFKNARVFGATPSSGGVCDEGASGKITYFPPEEFNEDQAPENASSDLTQKALRCVNVTLFVEKEDGSKYIGKKEVLLARPPVVLVHGINDTPDWWKDLMFASGNVKGIRIPYARVDHSMDMKGNGPVEKAAKRLQDKINETVQLIRDGRSIPQGDCSDEDGSIRAFDDYEHKPLAARRADVVAWSYGGVITRWYLASRGEKSPSSVNWYRMVSPLDLAEVPLPTDYMVQKNIRKVITLGSMWRGIPLCNYLNEARATDDAGVDFTFAPLNPLSLVSLGGIYHDLGAFVIRGTGLLRLHDTATGCSTEVMAIDSPWMCWLNYGNACPVKTSVAEPFRSDVEYGSVAGDDNNYFLAIDPYATLDEGQSPSWFPYLKLEVGKGFLNRSRNYTDGVVPVWSAAIPGSYKIAACSHGNYAKNEGTEDYILQWLNRADLPRGSTLNAIWNKPEQAQVTTQDGSRTWTFYSANGQMAPFPQAAVYEQRNKLGRINSYALHEIRSVTNRFDGDSVTAMWSTVLPADSEITVWEKETGGKSVKENYSPYAVKTHKIALGLSGLQKNVTYFLSVKSSYPYPPDPDIAIESDRMPFRLGANQLIVAAEKATGAGRTLSFLTRVFNNTQDRVTGFKITKVEYSPAHFQSVSGVGDTVIDVAANSTGQIPVTFKNSQILNIGAITVVIRFEYRDSSGNLVTGSTAPQRVQ